MLNLIIRTGLRTIEVSRALVGDIEIKGSRRILRIHGKGQDEKKQLVIISPKVWAPLKSYLELRPCVESDEPLFATDAGNALSTRTIRHISKKALRAIGLDDLAYSAHSLRHTAACSLLKAGAQLEDVREVLRHSSADTTRIYLNTIEEEMRLERASELILDEVF